MAAPEGFNRAWNLSLDSDALRPAAAALSSRVGDLRLFARLMIERYVTIPSQACREADREHLNLGMRWAWISSPDVIAGWGKLRRVLHQLLCSGPNGHAGSNSRALGVDEPVIIGEFHHGALDAGLTATGLEGVTSQERASRSRVTASAPPAIAWASAATIFNAMISSSGPL